MSVQRLVCVALLLAMVAGFGGCGKDTETPATTGNEGFAGPADPVLEPPENPMDFTEAAKGGAFRQAVQAMAKELGAEARPIEAIPGGVMFGVPHEKAEASLRQWHESALKRGAYLFRLDCGFGIGRKPDVIALLPTIDKYEVIQAAGTNGINHDITNAKVIAWLRGLEKTHLFVLTGAGMDFLEGHFVTPPKDPLALAKRMYEFCPDIVEQGTGDVAALARELRSGKLYFWWD